MARINIVNADNKIESNPRRAYFQLKNTGGPKGDKGDTGAQGPKGDTGAQGPAGLSASVTVGSTTTLEPGASATVTNSGDTRNAVLNFGIPTGAQGPQGIQGPKGDTGPEGAKGAKGDTGAAATVTVNATNTGAPGTNAEVQNLGDEHNAVLQFTIPRGDTGATGAQGPEGPAGQDGQSFAPTVVTELPETGDPSAIYFTEKAHTTQTATGNPITATITDEAGKMESFQLDGGTFQQTYTGKNLIKIGSISQSGIVANANEQTGEITYSGTSTSGTGWVWLSDSGTVTPTMKAGTYTFSIDKALTYALGIRTYRQDGTYPTGIGQGISAGNTSTTFTIDFDVYRFVLLANIGNEVTVSTTTIKPQIELGSEVTSFEPYVGGIPSPNPQYPQDVRTVTGEQTVTVTGKNLFDKNNTNDSPCYVNSSGVLTNGGPNISVYIPCEPNTAYTVSKSNTGTNNRFCVFDTETKPTVGVSVISAVGTRVGADNSASYTITTGANAHYIGVFYRASATTPSEAELKGTIQIEKGSTATAYTPYYKQTLPLNLGAIELCKLSTYQDYIYKDGDDWKVHKATQKVTLDGSEEWRYYNTVCQLYFITDYAVSNNIPYCGAFKGVSNVAGLSNVADNTCCFTNVSGQTTPRFYVRYSEKFTSANSIADYLTSNPTSLYYALATATDTIITDTNLIAQLEAIRTALLENGANTIQNTAAGQNLAGDMEIGYYGYTPSSQYDKWIWLNVGAAGAHYEQL